MKATDRWAVPLTRREHMDCHTVGSRKEVEWFQERGVDIYALANDLWAATGDLERMEKVVEGYLDRRRKGN